MLLLKNGQLFDGSGKDFVHSDLLIGDDRILAVGAVDAPPDCQVLECTGLAIAPGFIDLHSHADLQVLDGRPEKLKQGVTTEVVGNCGFSPFPCSDHPDELHEFGAGILGKPAGWGWKSASSYFEALASSAANVNTQPLLGHGSLRIAVAGPQQGPLPTPALERASALLEESLDAGCPGFSTGLMYAPGSSAGVEELEHFCSIVARKGKLYATHMRSYSFGLLDAVREQLDLARASGCRLQISHLQAAGRANWDLQRRALDEIETARHEGIDVEFDIYPYQCGSTVLTQWLPQWALSGGTAELMRRLHDPDLRRQIRAEAEGSRAQEWSDITISAVSTQTNAGLVGKTITDIAKLRGSEPIDAVLELLEEEHAAVNVISFNQSESNLSELLTHPLCSVISDGFYVNGKPHPRLHGTFPELLGSVVRERKWMPLPEAVHKITGKPAARLRLKDRGLLRPGYFADITVFDPQTIASRATYEDPEHDPVGIFTVIRNGQITYSASRS